MSRVTCDLTISLDGYLAGPNQTMTDPLGEGGERLHRWMSEEPEAHAAELEGILEAGATPPAARTWPSPAEPRPCSSSCRRG